MRTAVLFFLFLFLQCRVRADSWEIYIYNHPLKGKVISKDKNLYVPLQELAAVMGFKTERREAIFWVTTPTAPQGESNAPPTGKQIYLNGKPFSEAFLTPQGDWYVSLKSFAQATGNKVLYNKETRIIDVIPGKSLLTDLTVGSLERQMSALALPASPSVTPQGSTSASQIPASGPRTSLSRELEKFKEEYGKNLESRAAAVEYMGKLESWGTEVEEEAMRYLTRLNQATRLKSDQALVELSTVFKDYAVKVGLHQQSFYRISPPPEFAGSHQILQRMVGRYSDLQNVLNQLSNMALAVRTADEKQAAALNQRLQDWMSRVRQLTAAQRSDEAEYLRTLKAELDKLR